MSAGGSVNCLLMGDGSLLIQCGNLLIERGHAITAVVTASSQVARWAQQSSLTVLAPTDALEQVVTGFAYDWFFSIANLRIVKEKVWQRATAGAANFHDGPLPRHAGLNAPAWALLEGESHYGVTWHAMTAAVDEGDIYAQRLFEVDAEDSSITLNTKCFEAGLGTFAEMIEAIEQGTLRAQPQDHSRRTYHERLKRPANAATIDFRTSAEEIDRLGRALEFGAGYANPLGLPKIWCGERAYAASTVRVENAAPSVRAGAVIKVDADGAQIACADGVVHVKALTDEKGRKVALGDVLVPGQMLAGVPASVASEIAATQREMARAEDFFEQRLRGFVALNLPGANDADDRAVPDWQTVKLDIPPGMSGERALTGLLAGLARLCDTDRFDVLYRDDRLAARAAAMPGYIHDTVPMSAQLDRGITISDLEAGVLRETTQLARRVGCAGDLVLRRPKLGFPNASVAVRATLGPLALEPVEGTTVTFVVSEADGGCRAIVDCTRMPIESGRAMAERLAIAIAAAADSQLAASAIPLMRDDEERELLWTRNATALDFDRTATVHELIEAQAKRTPDAVAIVCGSDTLTYRQLDEKASRVAQFLVELGVGADTLVGLHLPRSCDLVVGALAILKAGGAYVPLDPDYPADRLALMIEDSGLAILIAERSDVAITGIKKPRVVTIDEAQRAVGDQFARRRAGADNLAYVIYTSGSTGRPKGVMIEHRNVVNFFRGMDDRIALPEPGQQATWLAVTSLSFDISVLELFWTLARGFKVVVYRDVRKGAVSGAASAAISQSASRMNFGLFYWGDDDSASSDKYRLLLEGARLADTRGFNAVWTPERHFHAFGGPYPNASVTGAAVAAITTNVAIRAGSCVLPLHHPARVAEEWAVIDNISRGRAAVAFASGWMPEDFLLRPENAPPDNKAAMLRDIDVVRELWRGGKVAFAAPNGKQVEIVTQPRPVQAELPVWLTTAGNVETFREAGRRGFNLLTHLLGQSIKEVGRNIAVYREALAANGHDPAKFTVTLMLHTLIGQDRETVRQMARGPMTRYLRSAAALIKEYAWAFPAFKKPTGAAKPMDLDLQSLEPDELDAIIEFAFLRYFEDSGLFGTVADAIARVNQVADIGVDEIACLIDFGVPADVALAALEPLSEVVATVRASKVGPQADSAADTIGALIRAHNVTHLQCTPAMATMMLASEEDRAGLGLLQHMFIGGEALQAGLLKELGGVTRASIENMYGPTETTIWSSTGAARNSAGTAPLGTPIANTQLYVLDTKLRLVPRGLPGELYIGGDGVARGYHQRDDLTRERFIANPFVAGGRIYRTGDVVRVGEDGELHYLGRADFQVKVRGYRIELGEIETCLGLHPAVSQAVVMAREDVKGDIRIVAYLRYKSASIGEDELKAHARRTLPEFMIPAHFVTIAEFPLTPNAKIDRKALPKPDGAEAIVKLVEYAAPETDVGRQIADVFKQLLGVERIGLNENFFDLGGHSLLAVQALRSIKAAIAPALSIADIYRFPTVGGLVGYLQEKDGPNRRLGAVAARAAQRRNAMSLRRTVTPE